jgi:hypothetical protein
MKIDYLPQALEALEEAPAQMRKAFQVKFPGAEPSAPFSAR